MKTLSIIFLVGCLVLSPQLGTASCYSDFLIKGKESFENLEFEAAIASFEAAKICPGISSAQRIDLEEWINKAKTGYIDAIRKARDEALIAKVRAQQMALTSEANRLAFIAVEEIENGNTEDAIKLAYRALNTSEDITSLAVSKAFGDAVYAHYHRDLTGHHEAIVDIVASKDGRYMLSLAQENEAILWNELGVELARLDHGDAKPYKAYFAPDGHAVLTLGSDQTARIWDLSGQLVAKLTKHKAYLSLAAYSPDASRIVTASRDGKLFLWDEKGNPISSFEKHNAPMMSLAFSANGRRVLSADAKGEIFLWNDGGNLVADLSRKSNLIGAKFNREGNRILIHSTNGMASLYDQSGQLLQNFDTRSQGVVSFDFAPGQDYLFTADLNGKLIFWKADGSQEKEFTTLYSQIREVNFSPDGQYLVINSINEDAALYTRDGKRIRRLDNHNAPIRQVEFAPDGASLLTLGLDGTAKLWDMSGRLLMNIAPEIKLYQATFQASNNQVIFMGEKQYLTICPSPNLVLQQLKTKPLAPLSQEKLEKYSLDIETAQN